MAVTPPCYGASDLPETTCKYLRETVQTVRDGRRRANLEIPRRDRSNGVARERLRRFAGSPDEERQGTSYHVNFARFAVFANGRHESDWAPRCAGHPVRRRIGAIREGDPPWRACHAETFSSPALRC